MLRPHLALVVAAGIALAGGCHGPRVDLATTPRNLLPEDYDQLREAWSRQLAILPADGIDNVLTADVTYLSFEFRWAYVVRVAYDLRFSVAERQALQEREFGSQRAGHEFYVTAMSGIDKWDDLRSDHGPWRIRLVDDRGREVLPSEIREIEDPPVDEAKYFSFDPVHRRVFRVTFPLVAADGLPILSDATREFSLLFSSALGQGEATWQVARPSPDGPGGK